MDQRYQFALEAMQPGVNMTRLCQRYGISKPTGYAWKARFVQEGSRGLRDRARRPHHTPSELSEKVVCELVKLKNHHRDWGPYKIRELYRRKHGEAPSDSSVKRVLERAGLVKKRRRRCSSRGGRIHSGAQAEASNEVWTVDFKGWWYTGDRQRCEPLTVRDEWSRYLLDVRILESATTEQVRGCFERLFKQYGLPKRIRSDNGPPFASANGLLGLSALSVWWLALGIDLERGRPGCPQDNGAHERMHANIKKELQCHAKGSVGEQQVAFDLWRKSFNEERPHESLGMTSPAEVYKRQTQRWEGTPADLTYPSMMTRRVNQAGQTTIEGHKIRISNALAGWSIGLEPIEGDRLAVYFAKLNIGEIDLTTYAFLAAAGGGQEAQQATQTA